MKAQSASLTTYHQTLAMIGASKDPNQCFLNLQTMDWCPTWIFAAGTISCCKNTRQSCRSHLPKLCHYCHTGLTSSSSFCVSASIRRISSMVSPTQLSIQQKSWRWKLVKILFSCCRQSDTTKVVRTRSDCSFETLTID